MLQYEDISIECPFCYVYHSLKDIDKNSMVEEDGDSAEFECSNCKGIFEITLNVETYCDIQPIEEPSDTKKNKDCPGQMLLFDIGF